MSIPSWSDQYGRRRATEARFGDIFSVPIEKRVRDVLLQHVADGATVLEVGAGDRSMGLKVREARSNVRYESLDIDPHGQHEYRDLAEVTKKYDCVYAFEVIEHLGLDVIPGWLAGLAELLKPGGVLVLSTPNTFYPPAFLRDVTHQTPLCYDELGALVAGTGLKVERIVRIYNDPLHRKLLRRYLFGWLFRLIGIDFARQIMLVAQKS